MTRILGVLTPRPPLRRREHYAVLHPEGVWNFFVPTRCGNPPDGSCLNWLLDLRRVDAVTWNGSLAVTRYTLPDGRGMSRGRPVVRAVLAN